MKLNIRCPKCGSDKISITSDEKDPTPLYKCGKCGYKGRLFPKFESDKDVAEENESEDENEDEPNEDDEDEEGLSEDKNEETEQF